MMFTGSPARKRTSQSSNTARGRAGGAGQNERNSGETSTRTRHNYEVK